MTTNLSKTKEFLEVPRSVSELTIKCPNCGGHDMTIDGYEPCGCPEERLRLIVEFKKELNTLLLEVAICKHAIYNASQTNLSREEAEKYWQWENGKKFFPSIFTDENFNRCGFVPLVIK